MKPANAQWIANAVGGTLVADVTTVVTSVEKDSREVTVGSLYVAFVGERVDGHEYVPRAVANGAVLSLVSQPVDAPHILVDDVTVALGRLARAYLADLRLQGQITVIGITGSNGKTTTKDLLAHVLPDAVAPAGSYNNEIGLPLTVLRADQETRYLVLEMGASGSGHISYLTGIAPLDIAVVLTVGSAHLGQYASIDDVAQAKAEIVDGLVDGGVAVLNADDGRVAAMADRASRVVTFGERDADVTAVGISADRGRARFELAIRGGTSHDRQPGASDPSSPVTRARVTLGLVGEHHVTNALAAAAVASACGLEADAIASSLTGAGPTSAHRMALTDRADGVAVLDDSYNASPESMKAALRGLLAVADGGRTVAVVGEMLEMGPASVQAHLDIGLDVVRLGIDFLLVVGQGARPIYDSAVREGSWGDEAAYVATIDEARVYLSERLHPGDTVLVKASHGSGLWELADDLVGATS
jgi:UDP-N-acetylmuramoyl-tripeptide--D-alanyl-D-alanine ligase